MAATANAPQPTHRDQQQRSVPGVRTLKAILVAAAATVSVAVLAGVGLLIVDPTAGSTTEAALGFAAAISGLTTAALVIAAVIYAHVRNLWTIAPSWIRYAVLVLVAIGVIRSIVSALS